MEARCPRSPGATTTPHGTGTPDWPSQSCSKPPLSTHHTRDRWLSGAKPSKTVKTYNCSHPSSQNPNRSHAVLTSGAYRGFAAIGDQWRRIMAACQDRRDTGIQIEKSETHIGDQIRSSRDNYFWRKSEPNAKRQKLRKPQWTPNPKNRIFLAQKPI